MPGRPTALSLLQRQEAARVPELLAIRYGRMAVSPFTYFRGAALPMAADLADTPSTGLVVQACGDAHVANFGLFASPERRLVFDINDFDETQPGPWEWDVKRLAASLEIAGRDNGYPAAERQDIVVSAVASYRRAVREFADRPALQVWYAVAEAEALQTRLASQLGGHRRKALARTISKAYTKDNLGALDRFAAVHDGSPRIAAEPPLVVPLRDLVGEDTDLEQGLIEVLESYRTSLPPERRALLDQYRLVDVARKVVGVGSVGTRSYMLLLLGDGPRDPLFLQAKEAGPSVLEEFVGPGRHENSGERVVVGQRLMQAASDIFLGWVRVQGFDGRTRDFYLRQLRDWKGSADLGTMVPDGMRMYGELCGWTLARAHSRSGDRIAIAAYLGSGPAFDHAVGKFARAYADQNEDDHLDLLAAVADGRVTAESGL
ncbi:DUF2252 domain-containing protein [Pseudonocardia broussonetiae]|nr:DUF2252 domain-containing protein [Pseudonocardia broussonetiae]